MNAYGLGKVLDIMESYPNQNSELKINLIELQEEATLMRIHQHPFSMDSFGDYKKWAGKKKLHALALDL
ncbi:MAG: hypothetical protein ACLFT5_10020, partial [Desulfovermiculus sp.]